MASTDETICSDTEPPMKEYILVIRMKVASERIWKKINSRNHERSSATLHKIRMTEKNTQEKKQQMRNNQQGVHTYESVDGSTK